MSKLESIITVEYHGKRYTIASIMHAGNNIPIVLDRDIYKILRRLDRKWYINDKNHVYCLRTNDDVTYPIYMHDMAMKLNDDIEYEHGVPIVHINNIHFDNRIENLQFDVPDKNYSKNMKKKKRTIDLSRHNINVDNLPTYMWYLKPDATHGGRFVVEIPGELSWRSTASKKVSLRYKLEEAKKFLRHIGENRPDLFNDYSMNGDLTKKGLQLYKDYYVMIEKAGFTMDQPVNNNTREFLIEDTSDLSNFEMFLLHSYDPTKGSIDINAYYNAFGRLLDQ